MKKQVKTKLPKATVMIWDSKGTSSVEQQSPEHKIRQSINQKTERSEQDVKKHLNDLILPHFILTLFNTVLLILALIA